MAVNRNITSTQPAGESIPLPAPHPRLPEPDTTPFWVSRLDATLVVGVLAFAFLVASYAAANSDFFGQVAAGRLLAQGRYHFGTDPFACTTEGVYWTNHAWLFDLVAYAVYDSFPGHGSDDACVGGVILVVAKALLVTLLAWLMIATGWRRGMSVWIPAACTALAILALSPRLLLNSTTLSYVYLGLTLFLLRQPRWNPPPLPNGPAKKNRAANAPVTVGYPFKAFWAIPAVCLLWVNTDSWFFLGPLTVALYLAGELIEQSQAANAAARADRPAPGELRTLGWVLLASVLVCFINPHHYHAWILPDGLGLNAAAETLRASEVERPYQFKTIFYSPFEESYYSSSYVGKNVAGLAGLPLLLLSLVSFGLNFRGLRPWRVVVWLPFTVLSVFHARAIPFFAIVSAPIMALNFLDFAAGLRSDEFRKASGWNAWRVGGRALCVVLLIAAVVATFPGWLQAQPFDRRRVAFHVHVEPSWKATAAALNLWQEQGLLDENEHWFNSSPDVFNYMAYFCDKQRPFLDQRLHLYEGVADDYATARKSLAAPPEAPSEKGPAKPPADPPWRDVFTRHGVRYVIFYNEPGVLLGSRPQVFHPLVNLVDHPEEWTPLYADGDIFIFGWHDPTTKTPVPVAWSVLGLNYDREAFGPATKPVEAVRPTEPPHVRAWYEALWEPEKPHSSAVNRALFHALYEDSRLSHWQLQENERWTGVNLAAGMATGVLARPVLSDQRSPVPQAHFGNLEPPPPGPTYLSVRELQVALADNPQDAWAYYNLGNAYYKLFWEKGEFQRTSQLRFPHIALLRHTQIVAALHEALALDPEPEVALSIHGLLADHYQRCQQLGVPNFLENGGGVNFVDVLLRHAEEVLRLSKLRGQAPEGLEKQVEKLKKEVEKRQNLYELRAANKPVVARAQVALEAGLGETAQLLLEKADPDDLKGAPNGLPMGYILRIKLLLSLGRVTEVREALALIRDELANKNKRPDWGVQSDLALANYDWFRVLTAAATADYDTADDVLAGVLRTARANRQLLMPQMLSVAGQQLLMIAADRMQIQPLLHEWILGFLVRPAQREGTAGWSLNERLFAETREGAFQALQQEADVHALRGWLLLEAGNLGPAARELREVAALRRVGAADLSVAAATGMAGQAADGRVAPAKAPVLLLHAWPLAGLGLRWMEVSGRFEEPEGER